MKKLALITMTFILLVFYSCKKDEEVKPDEESSLAENTVLIENSDWQSSIINIDTANYTITFNKNVLDKYSIEVGDIIVGTEDAGYLRKVNKIETVGNEIIIETEFAAITEAFKELHEQTSASITPNTESQEFWLEDGVVMNSLKSTSANLMNFSINTVLYDLDGNLTTTTDQVRISGSYELDADFYIDIDINNFEINQLLLQYEINQSKEINGYLGIGGLEYSKNKKLATIPCGTIPAGPVIIEPVIDIYAGFVVNMSTLLQMKIEQNYNSFTTINYQNGNWNTEKTVTENEVFEEPSISGVLNAKLFLKPVLRFRVYRTVSPYIEAELYGAANVELESDFLKWKTSLGFDMNAGVSMMIWNHTLFNFNTNLYNWEHIIAEGQTEYNNDWVLYDDFNDNLLNDNLWDYTESFGGKVFEKDDVLQIWGHTNSWTGTGRVFTKKDKKGWKFKLIEQYNEGGPGCQGWHIRAIDNDNNRIELINNTSNGCSPSYSDNIGTYELLLDTNSDVIAVYKNGVLLRELSANGISNLDIVFVSDNNWGSGHHCHIFIDDVYSR